MSYLLNRLYFATACKEKRNSGYSHGTHLKRLSSSRYSQNSCGRYVFRHDEAWAPMKGGKEGHMLLSGF